MMLRSLLWSPLLLSLLIQIALLPNGSNATYDGIITNGIVLEVTEIFTKMSDDLKKERGEFLAEAFYAKGAFEHFKVLSRAEVPDHPHHEEVHQHQQKEMEVLEKNILKIFSEAPKGKYEDSLKRKVENTIKAVEKAITFFEPKNPNKEEHTAHESKMQMEDEFGKKMFEEWEQMSKFRTWLQEKVQQIVEAGEEEKKDGKANKVEHEMAQKILRLLHERGSPFIAPHVAGTGTIKGETNENAGGGHHHPHLEEDSRSSKSQKKEMTGEGSANSHNHNHPRKKQKSDGNGTR